MFLGIAPSVWIIMSLCVALAFLYAFVEHGIKVRRGAAASPRAAGEYAAIALCCGIAVAATVISKQHAYVGSPMLALLIGIVIVNVAPERLLTKSFRAGATYSGKHYLSLGIIALGATLAFTDIFSAAYVLPLVLFNILLSFFIANLIGRKVLKVSGNTCTLVGGGTCVCGGTAIATLSPIVKASEDETAYAMTAIFLFDLLACLSYPYLALSLDLSQTQFGFLAGTAINDTSSVVAAQETYASLLGLEDYALPATIKVVRTSMIIVLALFFSLWGVRKSAKTVQSVSVGRIIWASLPKFILFFLLTVTLNTLLSGSPASSGVFYQSYFAPFFPTDINSSSPSRWPAWGSRSNSAICSPRD